MAENLLIQPYSQVVQQFDETFFTSLPTDLRYKKKTYQNYYPNNPVKNARVISFHLPAWTSATTYQLSEALLSIKLRIVNKDGEPLTLETECAPANFILASAFQDCKIFFNDHQITNVSSNYGYKAYMEATINFSRDVKDTILQTAGYYPDTYTQFDSFVSGKNNGFLKRENLFSSVNAEGKREWSKDEQYFIGLLPSDFQSTSTAVIPGVNIRIDLMVAENAIFLMSQQADAKFEITEAILQVPCAELSDALAVRLNEKLKKEAALIHFRRKQVVPFVIPNNTSQFLSDTLFPLNCLPSRIMIAFVTQKAYMGDLSLNAYNMKYDFGTDAKPCRINKVSLSLNGSSVDNLTSTEPTLDYLRMFLFNEMLASGYTNSISMAMAQGGYYFSFFDLTTSLSSGSIMATPVIRQGQIRVNVEFSTSTPENIVALVYSEYPSVIRITSDRQISTNFLT